MSYGDLFIEGLRPEMRRRIAEVLRPHLRINRKRCAMELESDDYSFRERVIMQLLVDLALSDLLPDRSASRYLNELARIAGTDGSAKQAREILEELSGAGYVVESPRNSFFIPEYSVEAYCRLIENEIQIRT